MSCATLNSAEWFTAIYQGTAFSLQFRKKYHEEQTPFQKIEIYDTLTYGNLMVIDDVIMLTTRDNFIYHEMLAHPVLYCHPQPQDVVIVGGGDCGTIREVLQHPEIKQVRQVEIDERVTRLAEIYFPELCAHNQDPRAQFDFIDAIAWMKTAAASSVDVIIVDSTDPIGPGEGLFNRDFYANCYRVLRAPGVLIHQSESPLYDKALLESIHHAMAEAGFANRHTLYFPQSCYPSGWWSATLAGKGDIDLLSFREHAALARPFVTKYYSPEIHRASLATPPLMQK